LAQFFSSQGLSAVLGNYPYWYLGTTPFRYLSGPILPLLLSILQGLLPGFSIFEIMFGVIGIFWTFGGIGVYWLVKSLKQTKGAEDWQRIAFGAAIFYLFGPIVPFLFRFSDGLYLIAFSLLPFILFEYHKFLKTQTPKSSIVLAIAISFVILIDSLIIPSLALGLAAILLATTSWGKIETALKKTFFIFLVAILISTLWYTPGYWLTLLGAPSLGGVGALRVAEWLGKLLPTAFALGMAIFSVKFFKRRDALRDFAFYWLFVFGFLTLIRFLSDPDFWLDWTAYGTELQLGLAMFLGVAASRIRVKKFLTVAVLILFLGIWSFIFNKFVLGTFQKNIADTVEYRISRQLREIAKGGERVFLSGTSAFWLNSLVDIAQVRGGSDQAAVGSDWRKAVWEVREGKDPQLSLEWLKKLKVRYLVVHTEDSREYYHDFKSAGKFETAKGFKKIYDQEGDRIYEIVD